MQVFDAIRARRSRRRFAGGPLARSVATALLEVAGGVPDLLPSARALRSVVPAALLVDSEDGWQVWDGCGAEQASPRLSAPASERGASARRSLDAGWRALDRADAATVERAWLDACLDAPAWERASLVLALATSREPEDEFAGQAGDAERGRRFQAMEIGAAAQSVSLAATSLGLATVLIAGIDDERAGRLFPDGRRVLGFMPVGLIDA